ncbi:ATP-binding protein [Shewanella surugensis]|uniref:ATP-binding protein n=1 Tax=Shewanella surugensis TaxID=212020 RepID=A0ABT0LC54_9GAMM|nr:ATP-binding protein [Shewanella surugensis]MCL1125249.1 ATP-binding protein [Shewanella surugensis]
MPVLKGFNRIYPSSLNTSREVSADIIPFWHELELAEELICQMELCLVEIVNNVFEHSYHSVEGDKLEIESYCEQGNPTLVVKVSDYGTAMPLDLLDDKLTEEFVVPDPEDPETWTVSNRGLRILQELTDKTEYISEIGRNTLTFFRHTQPESGLDK